MSGKQMGQQRQGRIGARIGPLAERIVISDVKFTPSFRHERRAGLCGWITCVLNGVLVLGGIALRKRFMGDYYLGFPSRNSHSGGQHFILRPLNQMVREEIERQILAAIPPEALG